MRKQTKNMLYLMPRRPPRPLKSEFKNIFKYAPRYPLKQLPLKQLKKFSTVRRNGENPTKL